MLNEQNLFSRQSNITALATTNTSKVESAKIPKNQVALFFQLLFKIVRDRPSFKGVNLSRIDLTAHDFSHLDFSDANLSDTILFLTNLSNANLANADLTNAELTGANLTDADLTNISRTTIVCPTS